MPDFNSEEISNDRGTPVYLYEFRLGTKQWRYASSIHDITVDGATYQSSAISDEGVSQSGDATGDDLKVSLPASSEVALLYTTTPPSETLNVIVRRYHYGNTVAAIVWNGIVRNAVRQDSLTTELSCRALLASLNRVGLRLSWGRNCPHALYDSECRVNRNNYGVTGPVASKGGTFLTVTGINGYGAGYFSGGYIQFPFGEGGAFERIGIEGHSGTRLDLIGTTERIVVGTSVTVYPGCARTAAVCNIKFNNLLNYGGFPHMPDKSPFDGDPVF